MKRNRLSVKNRADMETGHRRQKILGLAVGAALLVLLMVVGTMIGAARIPLGTVIQAVFNYDDSSFHHIVIRTVRIPRVIAGVMAGASLAVAGGVMQGMTRNPLGSPGILGINAGAAFAVVLAVTLWETLPLAGISAASLFGSTVAAIAVYGLATMGRGPATPLRLTLSGVIITTLLSSFTTIMLIRDIETIEATRLWSVGSLVGREWPMFRSSSPIMIIGLTGAISLGRQITTISLGEDIAAGLGQDTVLIKGLSSLMVVLMAGGAVSVVGPIGFVGLITPHIVRFVVGVDYRWILPYCAIGGAGLVTVADSLGRFVMRPGEIAVGIVMGVIGAPFFIYLAHRNVRG